MWGLERPTNFPKWIPSKSWCTKVMSSEGFAHGQGWRCTTAQVACWGVLWKKWNSWFLRCEGWKCLQISPNEYHENLGARKFWVRRVFHMAKVGGARRHRWLGGEFCEKMKFVIFEIWGLERPTNVHKWIPWNSWCTKVLSSEGLSRGQVGRCIVALPYGLGEFCEKMKFVVFEMWGRKRPTNIPKWIPWNSWCTKVLSSEGFAHG